MKRPLERFVDWAEHRTGLPGLIRAFLYEEIPASSGWHQVLGSVAVFLFLSQAFTGAMLAFNYAPTPGDAYNSLRYILTEVTNGRLMHGLHHWGASMMIVVVVLHMVQVFLWGAYKRPRETTWMVGVVLLLVTLAYGLTGYLLPWDNRAYWGTVVTTHIVGQAPLLGPYLQRLLGVADDGSVGVLTFARFYGMHVLILPPATLLLIALHVYLVRKHGVAPVPGDEQLPKQLFYPRQAFKDTFAIFCAFAILFTLAIVARVPLEQLADPTDTSYVPRPEWYFLFLFQSLKLFPGPLEVLGSVVLPTLAILAVLAIPFFDRSRVVRVTRRTFAIGVALLAGIGWCGLTAAALQSTPKESGATAIDYSAPTDWLQLSPEEMAGIGYFRQEHCSSCHKVGEHGNNVGPNLSGGVHRDARWMIEHFKHPAEMRPGTSMPPIRLSDAQLNSLAAFLLKLTPANASALDNAPDFAVEGAMVYKENNCAGCHAVNKVGSNFGPPLNGLARRHDRDWVIRHFKDPQSLVPDSAMPAFDKLSPKALDDLTTYLMALPGN